MGKGRSFSKAHASKITPSGRWAPSPNMHALCVGAKLKGQTGGSRAGVRSRFITASKAC